MLSHFGRTPTCDTDRQTQGHSIYRAIIASRGKNGRVYVCTGAERKCRFCYCSWVSSLQWPLNWRHRSPLMTSRVRTMTSPAAEAVDKLCRRYISWWTRCHSYRKTSLNWRMLHVRRIPEEWKVNTVKSLNSLSGPFMAAFIANVGLRYFTFTLSLRPTWRWNC